jgi:hypothetical protein
MSKITQHKEIRSADGRKVCLCNTGGGKMMATHWDRVNCKVCLKINEVGLSDKQLREIARRRLDRMDRRLKATS